jgi:hypothetical protein
MASWVGKQPLAVPHMQEQRDAIGSFLAKTQSLDFYKAKDMIRWANKFD